MASSTVVAPSLRIPRSADPSSLSCSSSPFLASALPLAPLKSRSSTPATVSVRCSLSNENQSSSRATARREILASIAAAGAALAVFSNASLAAVGPGTSGAERTAQKADSLLQAADKLNTEDAPKRFGPGIPGGIRDAGKVAQQSAGTEAVKGARDGAGDVTKRASEASGDIQKRTKNILGQFVGKKGEADKSAKETVGQVKRNIFGQIQSPKGGAENAAKDAVGQAQKNLFGPFQGNQGQAKNAAKDAVGQAQRKASEVTGGGSGVLESIKDKIQGIKENVAQ